MSDHEKNEHEENDSEQEHPAHPGKVNDGPSRPAKNREVG